MKTFYIHRVTIQAKIPAPSPDESNYWFILVNNKNDA